jgi:hypothetical protein
VSYSATLNVSPLGPQWQVDAGQTVTISGTYEQLLASGTVVGPTGFNVTTNVSSGLCGVFGNVLTCGFDFGSGGTPGFTLGIGATPQNRRWIHTFNVVGVPEPGTAGLLLLGFVGMALRGRGRA